MLGKDEKDERYLNMLNKKSSQQQNRKVNYTDNAK